MDAQETLVLQSTITAFVYARGVELALIELTGQPEAVDQGTALSKAGFTYHGLIGLMANGNVEIAPNKPLDPECMFAMGGAVRVFSQLLPALEKKADDSVSWLERLFALPSDGTGLVH